MLDPKSGFWSFFDVNKKRHLETWILTFAVILGLLFVSYSWYLYGPVLALARALYWTVLMNFLILLFMIYGEYPFVMGWLISVSIIILVCLFIYWLIRIFLSITNTEYAFLLFAYRVLVVWTAFLYVGLRLINAWQLRAVFTFILLMIMLLPAL